MKNCVVFTFGKDQMTPDEKAKISLTTEIKPTPTEIKVISANYYKMLTYIYYLIILRNILTYSSFSYIFISIENAIHIESIIIHLTYIMYEKIIFFSCFSFIVVL